MKDKFQMFLFVIVVLSLSVIAIGLHNYAIQITELKKDVEMLREDLQTQRDVFSSYLNGTLSKDVGGDIEW